MTRERRRLKWTANTTVDELRAQRCGSAEAPRIRDLGASHFDVVFQPIVHLHDGSVFAREALARCKIERFRNPDVLFEHALRQEAVGWLGRTIREVVFGHAASGRVFINLHPEELRARWLIRPDDPLCSYGGQLFLEVTESAAIEHHEVCRSMLAELRARTNAQLVVDDFGAGYSNLKRLLDLEPDWVKFDQSLVRGVAASGRQRVLLQELVRLCQALGASVIAEGIETGEDLAAVRAAGVGYGQGYLFAPPSFPASGEPR